VKRLALGANAVEKSRKVSASMSGAAKRRARVKPTVDWFPPHAHVDIVWDPPWDNRMSDAAKLELGMF
jgi:hypothetical protein